MRLALAGLLLAGWAGWYVMLAARGWLDAGNALPLGPNSDTVAFAPLTNNGTGNLPDVRYWTGNHTNEVVRLWARGQGSEQLTKLVRAKDAKFAEVVGHNSDGSYIDNTDVFTAIKANLVSAAQ